MGHAILSASISALDFNRLRMVRPLRVRPEGLRLAYLVLRRT